MDSSNPTASTGVDQYQIETCKTLSVLATHRDSKNDSIWDARREIQRRTTPCTELHGRYRKPKQLARNAKNPRKTFGFAARASKS
jgi:hypothetical protein